MRLTLLSGFISFLLVACGGTTEPTSGVGGAGNVGGSAAVGGASAVGGNASATGGSSSSQECITDSDCLLSPSCCGCSVYPSNANIAICAMACSQTACEALGLTQADVSCAAGRCTTTRDCRASQVACKMVAPTCSLGQVPSVSNSCYGPCTPVTLCELVDACSVCKDAGYECVTQERLTGTLYFCK